MGERETDRLKELTEGYADRQKELLVISRKTNFDCTFVPVLTLENSELVL